MSLISLPRDIATYIVSFTPFGTELLLAGIIDVRVRPLADQIPFVLATSIATGEKFLYEYFYTENVESKDVTQALLYLPLSYIRAARVNLEKSKNLQTFTCDMFDALAANDINDIKGMHMWDYCHSLVKNFHYYFASLEFLRQPPPSYNLSILLTISRNHRKSKRNEILKFREHFEPLHEIDEVKLMEMLPSATLQRLVFSERYRTSDWVQQMIKEGSLKCFDILLGKIPNWRVKEWRVLVRMARRAGRQDMTEYLDKIHLWQDLPCTKRNLRFAASNDLVCVINNWHINHRISHRRILTAWTLGHSNVKIYLGTMIENIDKLVYHTRRELKTK